MELGENNKHNDERNDEHSDALPAYKLSDTLAVAIVYKCSECERTFNHDWREMEKNGAQEGITYFSVHGKCWFCKADQDAADSAKKFKQARINEVLMTRAFYKALLQLILAQLPLWYGLKLMVTGEESGAAECFGPGWIEHYLFTLGGVATLWHLSEILSMKMSSEGSIKFYDVFVLTNFYYFVVILISSIIGLVFNKCEVYGTTGIVYFVFHGLAMLVNIYLFVVYAEILVVWRQRPSLSS